jgi:hypothetical protein
LSPLKKARNDGCLLGLAVQIEKTDPRRTKSDAELAGEEKARKAKEKADADKIRDTAAARAVNPSSAAGRAVGDLVDRVSEVAEQTAEAVKEWFEAHSLAQLKMENWIGKQIDDEDDMAAALGTIDEQKVFMRIWEKRNAVEVKKLREADKSGKRAQAHFDWWLGLEKERLSAHLKADGGDDERRRERLSEAWRVKNQGGQDHELAAKARQQMELFRDTMKFEERMEIDLFMTELPAVFNLFLLALLDMQGVDWRSSKSNIVGRDGAKVKESASDIKKQWSWWTLCGT